MWKLDGTELLSSSSSDEGLVVLGVLEDSVVSESDSGLVRISHPVSGTQTVETRLENSQRSLTFVDSVTLPKRGKVFMVSKEGFLYQVRVHLFWSFLDYSLTGSQCVCRPLVQKEITSLQL